ncbi:NAD(P)/FAD-dependent oxidoreductase [Zavarzinia sp. CC-PAN008]|uniref:NAD(P)/FAD-dependent oxidoreductase n=1 Tax=Zavarzinia sp. CC-PAN008 TaxID=3243332 RepID=UPI003F7422FE
MAESADLVVDFLVLGAGISGAGAAFALADHGRVVVLEAEDAPGYHTTGRSAAMFTPHYGGFVPRRISQLGRPFFENPPECFAGPILAAPRGHIHVARPGDEGLLQAQLALSDALDVIVELPRAEARAKVPLLRPELVGAAVYEPGVADMDVDILHQGFLRGIRARGGQVMTGARVEALERVGGLWRAVTAAGTVQAPIVVNASGAWADQVAGLAGVAPVGLVPKRRTALIVDAPAGTPDHHPFCEFVGEQPEGGHPYVKPEMGRVMCSLGDQTPDVPHDVQPDEFDLAVLIDWIERHTVMPVRNLRRRWAGLRCFVADDAPVCGFDDAVEGFFWLCGQGGYGIMMSPTLGEATAALVLGRPLPQRILDAGVTQQDLAPRRPSLAVAG